jgi:xyloglucan-specific endo-beta-1,4-glucanase
MRPEGSNIDVDETGLSAISTITNVALDLFADADSNNAKNPTQANYEIMVWLGSFGDPKPLGWNAPTKATQQLGDNVLSVHSP